MRLIRRYPNRKLYDVQSSRYVRLDTLHQMILDGEELRVESSVDGKDLTRVTLARLKLAEAEQAVRSIPEAFASQLGQGVEGVMKRLGDAESGFKALRAGLSNPLARIEGLTAQIERLQEAVDALQERLDSQEQGKDDE